MGILARSSAALLCGVVTVYFLPVSGLHAQEAKSQPTTTTTSKDKKPRVTLLERLVFGTGTKKVAIDTPQAVTTVDQEDLDNSMGNSIGDALSNVPGVSAVGSDRVFGEAFNIRGIGALAASDESKIIVNVDGQSKFYEQYRMGSFFSDPELYKSVEVLRGPSSSTLYGSGALGGVINLTTKDAADFIAEGETGAVRTKTSYDSNGNGVLVSPIFAVRLNDQAEFLGVGNYRRSGLIADANGKQISGSEFSAWSGLLKGTYRFGDNDEQVVRLSYQRWQSDLDDQAYSQTGTIDSFGTVDRSVTDQTAVLSYENPASDNPWLDLKASLSFSDTASVQKNASGTGSALYLNSDYAYQTLSGKVQNTFDYTGDNFENFLTIGTQISRQDRKAQSTSGNILFHPQGVETRVGLFAQDEFVYDDRLTLIPGARVDFNRTTPGTGITGAKETTDTAFSPKFAAIYKLNDTISIFGSVAHSERFPTVDELFSTSSTRTTSPNLKKETANNFEAGFALSFNDLLQESDGLTVKTTAFRNNLSDFITTGTVANGPYYVNLDSAKIEGVEVEASYDSDVVFGRAAYSLIRGTNERTGKPLDSIPADKLSLTIGTRLPDRAIEFGWKATFASDQNRVSNPASTSFGQGAPTSGYNVHGIFASWKPTEGDFKGLELTGSVDNLFNTQYRDHLSGDYARGRTFKIALSRQIGW
jgi:hemoglobin/transferrin/lactoferrin receptor protein